MVTIQAYPWPGNVRELENAISRAVVLARGGALSEQDLGLHGAGADVSDPQPWNLSLEAIERAHLVRVLRAARGNKRKAARLLQVNRPRLDRLLERHGILPAEYGGHVATE
jgi:DNA-binding NtrC family response regulator